MIPIPPKVSISSRGTTRSNCDGVGAFDPDFLQLLVLDLDIFALADVVAARDVLLRALAKKSDEARTGRCFS